MVSWSRAGAMLDARSPVRRQHTPEHAMAAAVEGLDTRCTARHQHVPEHILVDVAAQFDVSTQWDPVRRQHSSEQILMDVATWPEV